MAMRPYFEMYEVRAHRRGDPNDSLNISNIDGSGTSLLDIVERALPRNKFTNDGDEGRFTSVVECDRSDGVLDVVVNAGPYGAGADVVDADGALVHPLLPEQGILRPVLIRFQEHQRGNRLICASGRMGNHGAFTEARKAITEAGQSYASEAVLAISGINPTEVIAAWIEAGTVTEIEFETTQGPASLNRALTNPDGEKQTVKARVQIKLTGNFFKRHKIKQMLTDPRSRQQFVMETGIVLDADSEATGTLIVPITVGGRRRRVRLPLDPNQEIKGKVSFDPTTPPSLDSSKNPEVSWLKQEAGTLISDLLN